MKKFFSTAILLFIGTSVILEARLLRVEGSDFLPDSLIEALEAFAKTQDDRTEIRLGGSLLAFRDFYEGEADLIIVAMPFQDPDELDFPVVPLGYQIGTLIVDKGNPINSLSAQQIGGIFGSLTENAIARWSELGLSGAWQNRNIQAAYADAPNSPLLSLFSSKFLDSEALRAGIQDYPSAIQLEAFVSRNDSAIGLSDAIPLSDQLKTLRIESEDGNVAFGPTLENVNYGDYPLALPYYVCVPQSQYRFLAPYLEFLLSDEVAELLQDEGFFPVLDIRRRQLTANLPSSE